MPRRTITDNDVRDPVELRKRLADAYDQQYELLQQVEGLKVAIRQLTSGGGAGNLSARDRELLESLAVGSVENPVAAQKPVVPSGDEFPPVSQATDGEMFKLNTDGVVYIFDEATSAWVSIVASSTAHDLLSAVHGDTTAGAVARGALVVGDATPKWVRFLVGAANTVLRMNAGGTDPEWGAVPAHNLLSAIHGDTTTAAAVQGDIIVADSTPKWVRMALGSALRFLRVNAAGTDPEYFDLFGSSNEWTAQQLFRAASALTLGGGSATNGAASQLVWKVEQLNVAGGLTKDTTVSALASNSKIHEVLVYISTTISGGGVTSFQVGDPTTVDRFYGVNANLTAGIGLIGHNHWKGGVATEAAGPTQVSADEVRLTFDAAPTAGVVTVATLCQVGVPPTS